MKVLEPLSNLEISQSQSLMTQINQSREQDQNILIKLKNEGITGPAKGVTAMLFIDQTETRFLTA